MSGRLAILIVTYNSETMIGACLDSIPQKYRENVVIVDNASTDRTVQMVASHNVRVIPLSENTGFAVAANQAVHATTAEYVCFLNPDCMAPSEFYDEALKEAELHPADCIVPKKLNERGTVIGGRQRGYTRWKLIDDMLATNYGENPLTRMLKSMRSFHDPAWHWPHGACFLMSRKQFLALGGFDPAYFLYMVDVEFGRRLSRSGSRVLEIDSCVLHDRSTGSRISQHRHLSLLNDGRVQYAEMSYGPLFSHFLKLLGWPAETLRYLMARGAMTHL